MKGVPDIKAITPPIPIVIIKKVGDNGPRQCGPILVTYQNNNNGGLVLHITPLEAMVQPTTVDPIGLLKLYLPI
jgi:hypothetical protein